MEELVAVLVTCLAQCEPRQKRISSTSHERPSTVAPQFSFLVMANMLTDDPSRFLLYPTKYPKVIVVRTVVAVACALDGY